jgi:hypothetical protein
MHNDRTHSLSFTNFAGQKVEEKKRRRGQNVENEKTSTGNNVKWKKG